MLFGRLLVSFDSFSLFLSWMDGCLYAGKRDLFSDLFPCPACMQCIPRLRLVPDRMTVLGAWDFSIANGDFFVHVAKNQIDRFQRTPADLIKYLRYTFGLKKEYGSVLAFVQRERLKWEDLTPSGAAPFEDDGEWCWRGKTEMSGVADWIIQTILRFCTTIGPTGLMRISCIWLSGRNSGSQMIRRPMI